LISRTSSRPLASLLDLSRPSTSRACHQSSCAGRCKRLMISGGRSHPEPQPVNA
jgi:hypothetical protein